MRSLFSPRNPLWVIPIWVLVGSLPFASGGSMTSTLHDSDYRTFVLRLIALRKAAGLTQAELAARVAKPQSYISKTERFERRIDPAEFRAIVTALGHDPTSVFAEICSVLG